MPVLLTDLDRTLTGPDLRLDPRARDRLAELREAGVTVVVVSGRDLDHMRGLGLADVADGLVAENGCIVSCPAHGVLDVHGDGFRDEAGRALGSLRGSFRWARVMGSGHRKVAREAAALLGEAGVPHALAYNAEEVMLLPHGADKASGARALLQRFGARTEDVWAIGDGENDVALFAVAGTSGAPANAAPEAREAATVKLPSAYADGFLAFTSELLKRTREG